MFGLATSEDVRGVSRELDQRIRETDEAIKELAREVRFPTKGQTSPKLYTVTTWVSDSDGARLNVREFGNAVEVKAWESLFGRGLRVIGEGGVILVEMIGSYSYSLTEQKPEGEAPPEHVRGRIEYLIRQIEKLESENEDRRHYVGTLNHRIEMLELRLGSQSFGKQTEPKAMNKPQPKGAKR